MNFRVFPAKSYLQSVTTSHIFVGGRATAPNFIDFFAHIDDIRQSRTTTDVSQRR